jgi:hypothetical protein
MSADCEFLVCPMIPYTKQSKQFTKEGITVR